jgi:hypothetical protein
LRCAESLAVSQDLNAGTVLASAWPAIAAVSSSNKDHQEEDMRFALRFPPTLGQATMSLSVFVALLVALASVDQRVHDKFTEIFAAGQGVGGMTGRVWELADTVATAVRYQSIENAPMVLFATVGGILFLFMVRT